MLSTALIQEIDRLLKAGELSQRAIAAQLGVSRGIVSAIASGRRGLYGKEQAGEGRSPSIQASPPKRCSGCGYRVYMPCLICQIRKHRREQRVLLTHHAKDRSRPCRRCSV